MTASDWVAFRSGLALLGAGLAGFGISFAARPRAVSIFIALLGLVLLLTNASRRHWKQLSGFALLMAGSVGLSSIALMKVRSPIASEAHLETSTGSLIRGLVYVIFLALGWAERRYRAIAATD